PSLWAWQEEGWHFLAKLPTSYFASQIQRYSVLYDRESRRLWFTIPLGLFYLEVEDYTLNPFNSSTYKYQPFGWIEQDRFYGGQYLVDKDWESVTVVGDNLSANVCAKVYWQDEGST